ncbi:type I polyketide synthase [Actinocatenispora sera]|uniref:Acyl transferase domain-containing protein n=1 Tax=Actinocatenispora sera TaxID=390989 RepID=A0A810L0P7_9ACTN|nr:type I polyketide synthase [Actinocatenispora sera]BCJ28485.1 hypothetical protein Asera_25930 [Actinocatenispora sera]
MTDDDVERIALVGLACRVPGARDAGQFWSNLVDGVESIRFSTRDEQLKLGLPVEMVDHPDFVAAAPVIDDIEYFDPGLFGMSRREADVADPQHRLFLELSHTALQDAGYDPARYDGLVGVYAGTGATDYLWKNVRANPKLADAAGNLAVNIGNNPDYVATLVSYKLNLRGPSFTLHTACSTSMVAIHLACEALRNGECDMALAGGVCIELPHGGGYIAQDGGITAPDGHCRPFDARGAGTLWGSGGGVIVLKRLSDALADGDDVRAVILGNAINNDGAAKVGFSAPSVEGQTDVVAQALAMADIDPHSVSYVEAHGTATALGDPIEVAALSAAYGAQADDAGWCALGSVKSNIGHLSQGAGVAAVIKTVLALQHKLIPASINYETPNPAIDFATSPFYVNAVLSGWQTDGGPRRAGVSSFGIGGTNAHVVLEEAPAPATPVVPGPVERVELIQLSARSQAALATVVDQLSSRLAEAPETSLADVAHTLRVGREPHPYRTVVVAEDAAGAVRALGDRKRHNDRVGKVAPQVAFLFSGQGAQYAGMAAQLRAAEPVFAAAVAECAAVLGADPLAADAETLQQTRHAQPALFTVEYALARLWESWGVTPAAMIGHSIGEYVAATLAGVFAPADALRLVAARGRLMQSVPPGSMLAVQLAADEVAAALPPGLDVAAVNGPRTCVVSGPNELIDAYAESLTERGIGRRRLRTSHAFHSASMDPVLGEFTELVAAVERHAPQRPYLSNRTGDWITAEQATDPAYWAAHLRDPVRFGDCVARLRADGDWLAVECGPGSQLVGLARMQTPREARLPVPSLPGPDGRQGDLATLYAAAGRLWAAGIELPGFGRPGRRIPLPTYPYERSYHWVDPAPSAAPAPAPAPVDRGMAQWCSVPVWRQLPPAVDPPAAPRYLLLAAGEPGEALAAALGPDTVRAPALGPADRAGYSALLAELAAGSGVPQRIVHAWTLAPGAGVDAAVHSIVALGQALAEAALPGPVHLDVVTAGTRAVLGDDVTDPVAAGAAAAAWSLPTELPGVVTVRHVDAAHPSEVAAIAAELRVPPSGEYAQTVALRRGRRWAPEFEPVPLPAGVGELPDRGVYLITGGTGGIGGTVAEDLARRCRARIVLLARTPLPPREQWPARSGGTDRAGRTLAAIARIEAAGGQVLPVAADVTDAAALRAVRERILAEYGRLDGIVHAAGVPGGGLIAMKTREAVEAVLAPKIAGTRALAEVFGADDLGFVALCGSVTGVVGGLGQVDYAAANAYLDAVAHHGGGFGCPVLSVDWGAWSEVGMAVETARPAALGGPTAGSPAAGGSAGEPGGSARAVAHPVLTERVDDGATRVVRGRFGPGSHWVLGEHRIAGVPVLPGTGHLELARAAFAAAVPPPDARAVVELRDVAFVAPLSVPDGTDTAVQVRLRPGDGGYDVAIATGDTTHVRGTAAWVHADAPAPVAVAQLRERLGARTEVTSHRSRSGLVEFGGRWRNLRAAHRGPGEVLAQLVAPAEVAAELADWPLHPALLDEATSLLDVEGGSFLPLGYGRITVHAPLPAQLWAYLVGQPGDEITTADIRLVDDDGRVLVDIADFMLRRVDPAAMATAVRATPAAAPADRPPAASATSPTTGAAGPGSAGGISPAEGAEVLSRLLAGGLGPQVAVSVRPMDEQFVAAAATIETLTGPVDDDAGALDEGAAPGTALEAQLAAIWADVLGVPVVGRDDDFFDLGGNSLVAVQLIGKVRTATGVKLPMRSLFETTTVAGMAELVEQRRDSAAAAPAPAIPRLARPR